MQQPTLDFAVVVHWKDALIDLASGEGPFQSVFNYYCTFSEVPLLASVAPTGCSHALVNIYYLKAAIYNDLDRNSSAMLKDKTMIYVR